MSILQVFGANLRQLTALRGAQATVAEQLGIGRIQFQRYLRSESFPKPNVLHRICMYFGVDARILTELLTDQQLELVAKGVSGTLVNDPRTASLQEAIAYCCPDQDFRPNETQLPNGIYQYWRPSMARRELVTTGLVLFKSLKLGRVGKAHEYRGFDPTRTHLSLRDREFRGVLLAQREGFAMIGFHSPPLNQISMMYLRPISFGYRAAFEGFNCLARDQNEGQRRMARMIWLHLGGERGDVLRAARSKPLQKWEDIPEPIADLIRPGAECF